VHRQGESLQRQEEKEVFWDYYLSNRRGYTMSIDELKTMVGRECEFLSYYLEKYEEEENPSEELQEHILSLRGKWEAYDKVYRFIKDL
jgi:hypothetical protein